MRLLDAYLLKRFITILLFAVISFILIVIVVDLIGNLGKFIDRNVPGALIVKFYLMYVPFLIVLVLPVAMLLASLFSVGQMARYNELAAMKSTGISLYRILWPILAFSIFISFAAMFFGETVVPKSNREKTSIEDQYLDLGGSRIASRVTNILLRDQQDRLVYIGHFDNRQKLAHKVSIHRSDHSHIAERYDAKEMIWQDSTWVLKDGFHRTFTGDGEKTESFEKVTISGIDFVPEQLAESQTDPQDMSYTELRRFTKEVIRNGGNPASWLVDLNLKISVPFANFVMVLFGACLASNKKRSGVIVGIIISFIVSFLYFGMIKLFQTLGYNGVLSPFLSAWVANFIFLILGLTLLFTVRK